MAGQGRRRKPTHLHILNGNPSGRKLPENEPKPQIEIPEPPGYLDALALEEWDRLAPELEKLKLISKMDRAALEMYCVSYSRWRTAVADLEATGNYLVTTNGNVIQNPVVGVVNTAFDATRRMLIEFGMTPSSRSKVSTPGKDAKKDGWEDF